MTVFPHCFSRTNRLKPQRGSVLIFTVAFIVVLLGFLGMAVYTGMNAYVQNELQNAASTSAMVGASSYYDGDFGTISINNLGTFPNQDGTRAAAAATTTFNRIVANSPVLQRMGAQLDPAGGVTNNNADDSVQVNALATIPTPFLTLLGIDSFQVTANARSGYVKAIYPNATTGLSSNALGGNPNGFAAPMTLNLPYPVLDGPGPDLRITENQPYVGYMVEICSENDCYDVTPQAIPVPNSGNSGAFIDRQYTSTVPAQNRRVVYGDVLIDLSQANIRKGSRIVIRDDGIPDQFAGGTLQMLQVPPASSIKGIEVYHYATSCPAGVSITCQNSKLQDTGFFRMSTPVP